jgi:SRSO17 transposase
VDIKTLELLRPELDQFTEELGRCVKTRPSRRLMRTYVAGQLSDLQRKCVEPIALHTGVAPRTLQQFLATHCWDESAVVECLQQRITERHAHEQAIALIDETSFPKKGEKSPGVQRQHCGATGKIDNCVVSVHLGYVAGDFHALLDGDIYLPESWLEDEDRCQEAGIPEDVVYRTKPQIALEQVEAAVARGVTMAWLCADELYGRSHEFRLGVADLGLTYVVEIPSNTTGWMASRGTSGKARRVDGLWLRGGPAWESWNVKDTEKGPAVWDVRAVRFHPAEERVAGDQQWLIIARNSLDHDEVKYFLCNAGQDAELGVMLRVAFYRWHIERLFRETKTQTGMDHYEGRTYRGWRRHLALTSVSVLFLSEQRQRLREQETSEFTLEQVKQVIEVQLDPEMPRAEVRRQLGKVLMRIEYHQRRNATARKSHAKTKRAKLAKAGVDLRAARCCPRLL